eukprot:5884300-Prymnesium_polylepis.2
MAAGARALRMPVPRVHDISATLHVGASVRAPVSHSSPLKPYRTLVRRLQLAPDRDSRKTTRVTGINAGTTFAFISLFHSSARLRSIVRPQPSSLAQLSAMTSTGPPAPLRLPVADTLHE